MLDYRGVEALFTVHKLQGFAAAAQKLHITQSAVSQRIKALESHYGEPVLIRVHPYRLTKLGTQLIAHFKKICLLEEDLEHALQTAVLKPRISIALNRDSLETWFLDLIEEGKLGNTMLIEIIADDQELTLDYFKNGLVSACLSTSKKEISGCKIDFLGNMEYVLVASPEYAKQYFSQGNLKKCLVSAPALKFDQNDTLHQRYLQTFFGLVNEEPPYQVVPSVRGFKQFALLGYGYGLIPKIDIQEELKKKQLVELCPHKSWKIPLYWHFWSIESPCYQKFNANLIDHAKRKLS